MATISKINGYNLKDNISGYQTAEDVQTAVDNKQDIISDLDAIRSGAAAGSTAVQPDDLAAVATSGSYNDLTDKPTGGMTVTQLWTGSLSAASSSSSVYTITNGATYKIIVLLISIGSNSSITPLTIPVMGLGSSTSSDYGKWTNSDESTYATYGIWISGNDLKFCAWAGKGTLTYIYGIK